MNKITRLLPPLIILLFLGTFCWFCTDKTPDELLTDIYEKGNGILLGLEKPTLLSDNNDTYINAAENETGITITLGGVTGATYVIEALNCSLEIDGTTYDITTDAQEDPETGEISTDIIEFEGLMESDEITILLKAASNGPVSLLAYLKTDNGEITSSNHMNFQAFMEPIEVESKPGHGSVLHPLTPLTFIFNASMDIDSVVVDDAPAFLENEGMPFEWTTTTYLNDTLVVEPTAKWITSTFNIVIEGTDISGNVLEATTLSYTVRGEVDWYSTWQTGLAQSSYKKAAVASDGSYYVIGAVKSAATFEFDNGVTLAGTASSNGILVKYDSSGSPLWTFTVDSGLDNTVFHNLYVDGSNRVYLVGNLNGDGLFDFGNGVMLDGLSYNNAFFARLDSNGNCQVGHTVQSGPGDSTFYGVSVASDGSVYAAGFIDGSDAFDFGNSVTVTGNYDGANAVLVKYGGALLDPAWARSTTSSSNISSFTDVAADQGSAIYVVGNCVGTSACTFSGESYTGVTSSLNGVVLSYSNSGTPSWINGASSGATEYAFQAVAVDSTGNVYVGGYGIGQDTYEFGGGIELAGVGLERNSLIVQYNGSGTPQWVAAATGGMGSSSVTDLTAAPNESVYATLLVDQASELIFNNNHVVQFPHKNTCGLVQQIDALGSTLLSRTAFASTDEQPSFQFNGVAVASDSSFVVAGSVTTKTNTLNLGPAATITGTYSSDNILLAYYD
jgi:hypothetical protein